MATSQGSRSLSSSRECKANRKQRTVCVSNLDGHGVS
jgi:hypothetical protein